MTVLPPDPGPRRLSDLRRVLVIAAPVWRGLDLRADAEFTPRAGRYLAGAYRTPDGNRIAVAVDPSLGPNEFVLEDALTGEVVRSGQVGQLRDA